MTQDKANETTCQICGRAILSKLGLIAHHGYRRPTGQGWQTPSCPGARCLPYEVSCDVLPREINRLETYAELGRQRLKELLSYPPLKITEFSPWRNKTCEAVLPENFDPQSDANVYMPYSYENIYRGKRRRIELDIQSARAQIKFLNDRLSKWPQRERKKI